METCSSAGQNLKMWMKCAFAFERKARDMKKRLVCRRGLGWHDTSITVTCGQPGVL
jgi:hypothetical protein